MRPYRPVILASFSLFLGLLSLPGLAPGAAAAPDEQTADGFLPQTAEALRQQGLRLTQLFNRPNAPPADIGEEEPDSPAPVRGREMGAPIGAHDTGGQSVRIDRLENQLRSLTGQIEQLQFQVRRLEEMRKTPEAEPKPVAPQTPAVAPAQPAAAPALPPAVDPTTGKRRRGDAFDPNSAPNAPGAPKVLGAIAPGASGAPVSMQPMELGGVRPITSPPPVVAPPVAGGDAKPGSLPGGSPSASKGDAALAPASPPTELEEYDLASASLKQGQYDVAEKGFTAFLAKHPKSRLAPDAVFNLGESYFLRNRHSEAAEQYLKISTSYPTSPKGAQAYLRLGQSLNALNAKEQACASFSEVGRKFPNATSAIRAADRESKRAQC